MGARTADRDVECAWHGVHAFERHRLRSCRRMRCPRCGHGGEALYFGSPCGRFRLGGRVGSARPYVGIPTLRRWRARSPMKSSVRRKAGVRVFLPTGRLFTLLAGSCAVSSGKTPGYDADGRRGARRFHRVFDTKRIGSHAVFRTIRSGFLPDCGKNERLPRGLARFFCSGRAGCVGKERSPRARASCKFGGSLEGIRTPDLRLERAMS